MAELNLPFPITKNKLECDITVYKRDINESSDKLLPEYGTRLDLSTEFTFPISAIDLGTLPNLYYDRTLSSTINWNDTTPYMSSGQTLDYIAANTSEMSFGSEIAWKNSLSTYITEGELTPNVLFPYDECFLIHTRYKYKDKDDYMHVYFYVETTHAAFKANVQCYLCTFTSNEKVINNRADVTRYNVIADVERYLLTQTFSNNNSEEDDKNPGRFKEEAYGTHLVFYVPKTLTTRTVTIAMKTYVNRNLSDLLNVEFSTVTP